MIMENSQIPDRRHITTGTNLRLIMKLGVVLNKVRPDFHLARAR
jgi:hypothetical protein